MPLSITATPMPLPSAAPSDSTAPAHTNCAPVIAVVTAMCERTTALPDTDSTSLSCASASSDAFDALNTAPDDSHLRMRRPCRSARRSTDSVEPLTMTSTSAVDAELRNALRSDDKRARRPPASADTAEASNSVAATNARNPHRHSTDAVAAGVQWAGFRCDIGSSKVRGVGTMRLIGAAHLVDRIHQHALRSADSPDGAQTPVADAVVHGAAGYAQQLGGLLDAHTAAELGLELVLTERQWLDIHIQLFSVPFLRARAVPTRQSGHVIALSDCNDRGWCFTMRPADLSGLPRTS